MAPAEGVVVEVLYCAGPGEVDAVSLTLPAGSTLADAVSASGLLPRHGLEAGVPCGIWGKVRPAETVLRPRDRVELYRPLTVDPKEARRLRYKRHRAPRQAG